MMHTYKLIRFAGAVLGMALGTSAYAINGCTTSVLTGNFGMQLSGTSTLTASASVAGVPVPASVKPGGAPVPVAGIAWLYMDGSGYLSGYAAANLAGAWLQGSIMGSYSVNTDCTATFMLTDSTGAVANFSGVVVAQGTSAFVTQTDAGAAVSGRLRPIRGFCQTADLVGTFGIQYSGTDSSAAAFNSTGVVTLDGQGDLTATESRFSGTAYSQVASTGTITVNPDCSASLSLTANGSTVNLMGTISFDEKQLFFVRSDAGTAVSGLLVQQ
jgi:hypothetical protein